VNIHANGAFNVGGNFLALYLLGVVKNTQAEELEEACDDSMA
jgi:hypothetical protein